MSINKRNRFSALEKKAVTNPATTVTLGILGVENNKEGEEKIKDVLLKNEDLKPEVQAEIIVPLIHNESLDKPPISKNKSKKSGLKSNEENKTKDTVTVHISPGHLKDVKLAILSYDLNLTIQEFTEVALLHYINTVLPKRRN